MDRPPLSFFQRKKPLDDRDEESETLTIKSAPWGGQGVVGWQSNCAINRHVSQKHKQWGLSATYVNFLVGAWEGSGLAEVSHFYARGLSEYVKLESRWFIVGVMVSGIYYLWFVCMSSVGRCRWEFGDCFVCLMYLNSESCIRKIV